MRVVARAELRKRRKRRKRLGEPSCAGVSHHEPVTALRPHTKLYNDDARKALGIAFTRAREAAGLTRPEFSILSGVGKTSLYKLESGIPVGPPVYEAAARALSGWDEDDPRKILEGGQPPRGGAEPTVPAPESAEHGGWTEEDEDLHQALAVVFDRLGLKPTAEAINAMRAEWERERAERVDPDEAGHA